MTLLIDSHILIWHLLGDSRLEKSFIKTIEASSNKVLISKASIWKIAIKVSIGKLEIKTDLFGLENYLLQNGFEVLEIEFNHLDKLVQLPFHHNDPFDRIIIAQAISMQLPILTNDDTFLMYEVRVI